MRNRLFLLAALSALAFTHPVLAQAFRVLETMPANGAVLTGISSEYFVRFDRPVDHLRSYFIIKSGDREIQKLELRYKTEPDVLFARAPTLAPGSYTMWWSLRLIDGTLVQQGEVNFSVSSR
jgi:methionine-rich copper-binding protein CopC